VGLDALPGLAVLPCHCVSGGSIVQPGPVREHGEPWSLLLCRYLRLRFLLLQQLRVEGFRLLTQNCAFHPSGIGEGVGEPPSDINLATVDISTYVVITIDPDHNPHSDMQALPRAHRIGQKNKVPVPHIMTRDTVEEKIIQVSKKKKSLDHLIIERTGDDDSSEIGAFEVENILSFGAKRLFEDTDAVSSSMTVKAWINYSIGQRSKRPRLRRMAVHSIFPESGRATRALWRKPTSRRSLSFKPHRKKCHSEIRS